MEQTHLVITVYVQPNSKKPGLAGHYRNFPKIKLASAPKDNEANEELILFISELLTIPKRDIIITSGEKSRIKSLILLHYPKKLLPKELHSL